ncbi:unnamed protein product [Prorocentrum cordatum]|uniref:Uncharacterized protein n=1 Tax=Prorocentrum cordatum TaxID=2364126 RepID=A0ABN9W9A7_9DINO|nr:unnamed protein product [Polarella glacialis]
MSRDFNGTTCKAALDFDLSILQVTFLPALSQRHVEAHPHWVLPSGEIFADWRDIWQIFAVTEAPDDKFIWRVYHDRRLTMLQVVPTPHTGCVDYPEPGQQIANRAPENRLDAVLWQDVKETIGVKIFQKLQVREGKGHKLARRWLSYQEHRGQRPTGKYGTDLGILNIFDWDTTDPDAREAIEPSAGWDAWSADNQDDLPKDLWDLWEHIQKGPDTHWPPMEVLAEDEAEDRDDEDDAPRGRVRTPASVWPSAAAHGKRGRSRSRTRQSRTGEASRAFGGTAMLMRDKSRAPERDVRDPADLPHLDVYSIARAAEERVTFFDAADEPAEHHRAGDVSSCVAKIHELRFDPLDFCVYDPDPLSQKAKWMSEQVYRAAIELTKDFSWTDIDPEIADDDAMQIHLAEVGQYRASLASEIHLLNAHRDALDLVHRDLYMGREDAPPISAEAHNIEACMQYLQQAEARALWRGVRTTPDTFQRAAVEMWPQHVHEAAVRALAIWGMHGAAALNPARPVSPSTAGRQGDCGTADRARATAARAVAAAGEIAVATAGIGAGAAATGGRLQGRCPAISPELGGLNMSLGPPPTRALEELLRETDADELLQTVSLMQNQVVRISREYKSKLQDAKNVGVGERRVTTKAQFKGLGDLIAATSKKEDRQVRSAEFAFGSNETAVEDSFLHSRGTRGALEEQMLRVCKATQVSVDVLEELLGPAGQRDLFEDHMKVLEYARTKRQLVEKRLDGERPKWKSPPSSPSNKWRNKDPPPAEPAAPAVPTQAAHVPRGSTGAAQRGAGGGSPGRTDGSPSGRRGTAVAAASPQGGVAGRGPRVSFAAGPPQRGSMSSPRRE